jgi:subtilisin
MRRPLKDKLKLVGYAVLVIVVALAFQILLPDDFGGGDAIPPDRSKPVLGLPPGVDEDVVMAGSSGGVIPGQYIVVLKDDADLRRRSAAHRRSAGANVFKLYSGAVNGYAARLSPDGVEAVEADPAVLFVSEDRFVSGSRQSMPKGINRFDAELSTTKAGNGTGSVKVNVAVLDSGVDLDHPDLTVVGSKNCSASASADDENGHGTHVAGTLAAKDDSRGVVGAAPGARIWAVRVLDASGWGTWSTIICGIDWVTSTRIDTDPGNDIAVANMSFGGRGADDGNCGEGNNDALHRAICRSVAAGVTYVAAAGNSAADVQGTVPAAYNEVLTVTAVADFNGKPGGGAAATCTGDVDDTAADFSNYATLAADKGHTIGAPGACIVSTFRGGAYATMSGTSMAAPHVAGMTALCIATSKCVGAPAQIIQKIRADARAYSKAAKGYGFTGDPLRPLSGKFFGYLTHAAAY